MTNEMFIEKSRKIHGGKYDYSKVNYTGAFDKVCIICPEHGEFWQRSSDHIKGCGCAKCRGFYKTTDEWISLAKKIHGDKYDYSKSKYTGSHEKIKIICPEHGEFWQVAKDHLYYGCNECSSIKCGDAQRFNTKTFIEKAQKKHNYMYCYSKAEYSGYEKSITITCPIHGDFITTPHTHLSGHCCPICAGVNSYYENKLYESIVSRYKDANILKQFRTSWLKYKHKMSIDIFLQDYNIGIEYQGGQHFKPVSFYGGINNFKKQTIRDELKFNQCEKNNVELLYFSYFDKEPEDYKHKVFHDENELFLKIDSIIKKYK